MECGADGTSSKSLALRMKSGATRTASGRMMVGRLLRSNES
jgi:hypothetical protein